MKNVTKETLRIFWTHARQYRLLVFVMGVCFLLVNIGAVIEPLFLKRFFDVILSSPRASDSVNALTRIILTLFALQFSIWVLRRIALFIDNYFQPRVMIDIANTCFDYLQRHSYRFFSNQFVGSLVRKVNRFVDAFEGIEERIIGDIFPIVIRISAILIVLAYRDIRLSMALLVWVIAYLVLNYFFTMYRLKYDVRAAEINSEVTGRLADTITNNVNIKVFTGLAWESGEFKKVTDRQFRIWRFSMNLGETMSAVQGLMMIGAQTVIFLIAIRLWAKGILTLGDFALIQAYLLQIFDKLWNFGRIIQRMYKYLADSEEMTQILLTPHEITDKFMTKTLAVNEGKVEFRNVSFTYTQTRMILDQFNLIIRPGERIGLVGLSGAGKSTIATLILRFFDVTEGGIYVDNINIADVSQESLRAHISYVPQDPILFHRTLMENIRYGRRDASNEEVYEAARLAHCDQFIASLSQGYDTYVGERGIKLSGGERQRIAIARAILKNAPILVLDEATSSLDSQAEAAIQSALENLMKGKTAIVIAHRLSTIMKMDRIIVMDHGRIVEQGTHTELTHNPDGIYRKLWELQAGGFKKPKK